jgi:uncharacterized short protein YbdD (DUF466 family)
MQSTFRSSVLPAKLRRALRVLRTIIGEPDYDRYLTHMREHHPGCEVASYDDFMRQRLESRYSRPGSRCC